MQDADIYLKTEAGRDEIRSRSRGLSMATRAILLMVDGQRSVAALRTVIAGSKAPDDTLDMLLAQGLIEGRTGPAGPPLVTSISTPRSATMARPTTAVPTATPTNLGSLLSTDIGSPPAFRGLAYDGPLDLTLATIAGPSQLAAPSAAGTETSASRYEHLYTMMNEIVRDFLPAHRRYFIQLKIERCGTADELMDLLTTVETALAKSRGDTFASEVVSRLRNAVGPPAAGPAATG